MEQIAVVVLKIGDKLAAPSLDLVLEFAEPVMQAVEEPGLHYAWQARGSRQVRGLEDASVCAWRKEICRLEGDDDGRQWTDKVQLGQDLLGEGGRG